MSAYLAAIVGGVTVAIFGPVVTMLTIRAVDALPPRGSRAGVARTNLARAAEATSMLRARRVLVLRLPGGALVWRSSVSDRDSRHLCRRLVEVAKEADR